MTDDIAYPAEEPDAPAVETDEEAPDDGESESPKNDPVED